MYVDLHIHSSYYPGASKDLTLENLAKFAKLKGLDLVGTGDSLHPKWRAHLKRNLRKKQDIYENDGVHFIPTAEVKLNTYVHSVIVLPTLEHFDRLYDVLRDYGKLNGTGVPFVYIPGEEILRVVDELDGFLFPAHPFIPFQSIYVKYRRLSDYFSNKEKDIFCVEITPSVDNYMVEKVKDFCGKSFLSNSDCHSPMHLARSFNLIHAEPSFYSIFSAIKNGSVTNYEIPAPLGRYYETRCKDCGTFYRYGDAKTLNLRCEACGGKIWIGTKDRIKFEVEQSCSGRERKIVYHIPLDLIFRDILEIRHPAEEVLKIIEKYKEIELLHFLDLDKVTIPEKLKWAIKMVRDGKYFTYPGGAWKPGKIVQEEPKVEYYNLQQKTLDRF